MPEDLHADGLVDAGEAHVADGSPTEVMEQKGRHSGGLAGLAPSTQLGANWTGTVEKHPRASCRASLTLSLKPTFHLTVLRQLARLFPFGLGCLQSDALCIEVNL